MMCESCQVPDRTVQEGQKVRQGKDFSYYVGPLAVIWISKAVDSEHFCWRLIRDRLHNCYHDASHLVSDFRPTYIT